MHLESDVNTFNVGSQCPLFWIDTEVIASETACPRVSEKDFSQ